MRPSGFRTFWLLTTIGALFVVATLPHLPSVIATNFDGSGTAHAWMKRPTYGWYLTFMGLVLPALIVILTDRNVKVRAGRWWLGSLFTSFALGLHILTLWIHQSVPPQLPTVGFVSLIAFFVVGLLSWIACWNGKGVPPE